MLYNYVCSAPPRRHRSLSMLICYHRTVMPPDDHLQIPTCHAERNALSSRQRTYIRAQVYRAYFTYPSLCTGARSCFCVSFGCVSQLYMCVDVLLADLILRSGAYSLTSPTISAAEYDSNDFYDPYSNYYYHSEEGGDNDIQSDLLPSHMQSVRRQPLSSHLPRP